MSTLEDDSPHTGNIPDDSLGEHIVRDACLGKLFGSTPQPRQLGRYALQESIGAGGMGEVFAAWDPKLDRRVAVKVLRRDQASPGSVGHARLLREAKAMARLDHPNTVAVHDVGTVDGLVFIAMEFVEGCTLAQWLRSPRPEASVVAALRQAAQGLAAVHRAGLVHRDFKPHNIMISGTEANVRARVTDFGLARYDARPLGDSGAGDPAMADSTTGDFAVSASQDSAEPLTQPGRVVGTPLYMAPEQFGGQTSPASDQFSFCLVLYEALTGKRLYAGQATPIKILRLRVQTAQMIDPGCTALPKWLRPIVLRGLATEPQRRWPDMQWLAQALHPRARAPRHRRALLALPIAAGGVAAVLWSGHHDPCDAGPQLLGEGWSPARSSAVSEAFNASDLPYAAGTLMALEERLDTYAEAWIEHYLRTCEATHVLQAQSQDLHDLRLACLHHSATSLDALTSVLAQGGRKTLGNAIASASTLPELSACDDACSSARCTSISATLSIAKSDPTTRSRPRSKHARPSAKYSEKTTPCSRMPGWDRGLRCMILRAWTRPQPLQIEPRIYWNKKKRHRPFCRLSSRCCRPRSPGLVASTTTPRDAPTQPSATSPMPQRPRPMTSRIYGAGETSTSKGA